tara:strand:+ start:694 stop:1014 length:321 start_codon:yes stop_codon:yes gene_type:complete
MELNPTHFYIISGILVGITIILSYIVYNLLRKVENYEDVTVEQANYMRNISNLLVESQKHLNNLDERGVFKSDDEVGYFFENLKLIQKTLDQYQLPDNYAKKEIKS